MFKALLISAGILFAAASAHSQERLLSALEVFSIEPGRITTHQVKAIKSFSQFSIDVIKISDVRGDTSRRGVCVHAANRLDNERFSLYFDPAEAYGVLNMLEYIQRVMTPTSKGGLPHLYTTANGVVITAVFPDRDPAVWGYINFQQLYAYSNEPVAGRVTTIPYRQIDQLVAAWKEAIQVMNEL